MSSLSFSICVFFELKMGKFQIFFTIYLISPDYKWDSNVILHCILIFKTMTVISVLQLSETLQ